jgi:hypothetical protein
MAVTLEMCLALQNVQLSASWETPIEERKSRTPGVFHEVAVKDGWIAVGLQ